MSSLTKENLNRFIKSLDNGIESCTSQEHKLLEQLDSCYLERKSYIKEKALAEKLLAAIDILSAAK